MDKTRTKRNDVERLVTVENKIDSLSNQVKDIDTKFDTFIDRVDQEIKCKADKSEVHDLRTKYNNMRIRLSYFSGALALIGFLALIVAQYL